MKMLVVKSALVAALCSAPLVSATERAASGALPAPLHVLNFSPSFANHPADLTLLSDTKLAKAITGTLAAPLYPFASASEFFMTGDRRNWHLLERSRINPLSISGRVLEPGRATTPQPTAESLRFDSKL